MMSCGCASDEASANLVQQGEYHKSGLISDIYPDFVMMAQSFGVPGKRILRPEELRPAIKYVR